MLILKARTRRVAERTGPRHSRRKAQALVEMALMGTLLALFLAGAVDLGRAYYTSVVVANMAAEGAAYAAIYPDRDANYPTAQSCSRYSIASGDTKTIQERARRVATNRGLIIRQPSQASVTILNSSGATSNCLNRCSGGVIAVKVTYVINDLFLPGMLGRNNITVTKTASQRIMSSAWAAQNAGNCSP